MPIVKNIIRYPGIDRHYEPNQHSSTININDFGFRGAEFSLEKEVNSFRIFVVGGSTVYGSGSTSDNTTIPAFLQSNFEQLNLDVKVEVINAGISGAFSADEVKRVREHILQFDPDLILVYGGVNDFMVPYEMHLDSDKLKSSIAHEIILKFRTFLPFYKTPLILPEIYNSLITNAGIKGTEDMAHNRTNDPYILEKAEIWKNRWLDICNFGQDKNFETIVILQPILGSGTKILSPFTLLPVRSSFL